LDAFHRESEKENHNGFRCEFSVT